MDRLYPQAQRSAQRLENREAFSLACEGRVERAGCDMLAERKRRYVGLSRSTVFLMLTFVVLAYKMNSELTYDKK